MGYVDAGVKKFADVLNGWSLYPLLLIPQILCKNWQQSIVRLMFLKFVFQHFEIIRTSNVFTSFFSFLRFTDDLFWMTETREDQAYL